MAILGAPLDAFSSRTRGQASAPFQIRVHEEFESWVDPYLGDLGRVRVTDLGDVGADVVDPLQGYVSVRDAALSAMYGTNMLCTLGGDHTVTAYALEGIQTYLEATVNNPSPINVIHLDAHSDMWDHDDPDGPPHHGSWVRWVLERNIVQHVYQLGVRALGPDDEVGMEGRITRKQDGKPFVDVDPKALYYLSVDMDVVDPAFAPGVAYREPGGWDAATLLRTVESLVRKHNPIGMDIVETIPDRDRDRLTVGLAHRTVLAAVKGIAGRKQK